MSPSGKALDFDSSIRRFDPYHPSQIIKKACKVTYTLFLCLFLMCCENVSGVRLYLVCLAEACIMACGAKKHTLNHIFMGLSMKQKTKLNVSEGKMAAYDSLMVFTGNANPELAVNVVKHLDISIGRASVGRFSDGEVAVELLENVRGRDVFILQPTCAPTNDNLMEILTMADALKRASAGRITAAIPYFGYARQDRRPRSVRVPISAKLVANMLYSAGVDRVLTVDLHADQIQGFFDIPVDNVYATPILTNDIIQQRMENVTVVSPDIGGVVRARAVAKMLHADLAIIDKRRPKANVAEVMNIIGDIEGRTCVIVDDMIDTANTLCKAASALKERGAARVLAYATHPVFSGEAVARINSSDIDEVVITDTIPLSAEAKASPRIRQVTIAGLMAETVRRISNEESVSYLFNEELVTPGSFLP